MGSIAFCGTRGLPANYGGFETAIDEISQRFIENGYDCDVFCRQSHTKTNANTDADRNLIYVQGSKHRRLDTFISSIQTGLYLFRHRKEYKHIFWFNNANFPGILLSLTTGVSITINTDGLEWRRKKWSLPFKAYYFLSSALISFFFPRLISDSHAIQNYYRKIFKKKTHFIPYGIPAQRDVDLLTQVSLLKELELKKGTYFLQITRIEPDNLPLEIVKGFQESGLAEKGFKYVVIGYKENTPYASKLKELHGQDGIVVLPANYDLKVLYTLRNNCYSYVHGNSVGGTNPALLEAMASCPRILAIDVVFSRDVLGEDGCYFTLDSIEEIFIKALSLPDRRKKLENRVKSAYQWDAVADSYMAIVECRDPVYRPKKTYR